MKANELRLGNWVYNETTQQEMQVYPMMIVQLSKIEGESNIKPIPLTEEWLIKFGFKLDEITDEYYSNDNDSILHIEGYLDEAMNASDLGVKINHVHQLQNLYFALTGEELILKKQ